MNKRRFPGCLVVLCAIVLLLIGGYFTMKLGYCRGWWGKENLFLRSLWLCSCSPEFEQSLYPDNVEVLVSACQCNDGSHRNQAIAGGTCDVPIVRGNPEHNRIMVGNELIDLFTHQRRKVTGIENLNTWIWLSEDFVWLQKLGDPYLYIVSVQQFISLDPIYTVYDQPDLVELSTNLKSYENVYWICAPKRLADSYLVAYNSDVIENPYQILYWEISTETTPKEGIDAFLEANDISFKKIDGEYCSKAGAVSPSGRFRVEVDGLYNSSDSKKVYDKGWPRLDMNSKILSPHFPYPPVNFSHCWRSDEKEVVFFTDYDQPPIHMVYGIIFSDTPLGIMFDFPQPVLKVTLPDELFDSVPAPTP